MMEQTGGEYRGFHEDHINPNTHVEVPLAHRDGEHYVTVNLDYEVGSDGDLRIVQR